MNNTNKMQLHAVYKVGSKRMEKINHKNTNQRTAREVVLILDKVVLRTRHTIKETQFIMIKR